MDRLPQLRAVAGLQAATDGGGGGGDGLYSPVTATTTTIAAAGRAGGGGSSSVTDAETSSPSATAVHVVTFADVVDEADREAADAIDAYYHDATAARATLDEIVCLTATLASKHAENMQVVDETRSRLLRSDIAQLSDSIAGKAQSVKDTLDAMAKRTAPMKADEASVQAHSAVVRIADNLHTHLVARLAQVMSAYQQQQAANEAGYVAQTQRQIKIKYTNEDGSAMDDATARQLAEQVLADNTTSYIFQQSKDVLASIIETRNDIYRIEQSMRNLNQIFHDLAFLVYEQGELMDVILANVQASTRYVERGEKELRKGRKYQKKSRKKMMCIVVIVVIIVALFVAFGLMARFIPK